MTRNLPRGAVYLLQKTIALSLCVFMISSDVAFAIPNELGISDHVSNETSRTADHDLAIPSEIGTVDESYQGTNGKTIIYIQDAHDSLDAQENIAKMIDHLVETKDVQTVFTEGYEGPMPNDEFFGFIEEPKAKERVSYFFMDQLRIGGAEFAHINRKKDFDVIGADSIDLHLQNIKWYQESSKRRQEIERDLKTIEKYLQQLADTYFPKELKQWMKWKKRLNENQIDLLDYLKRLAEVRHTNRNETSDYVRGRYPSLYLLLAADKSNDPELLKQAKGIRAKTLFQEIDSYEKEFSDKHLFNDRDQNIFEYYRSFGYLKRLNRIEISYEEYDVIKKTLHQLKTKGLAEFILKHTGRSLVLTNSWEDNIRHAMKFYAIAEQRDEAVSGSLEQFRGDVGVLVFGGFHKENIRNIMRGKGYSYHIVTPKITSISDRHQKYYRQLMQMGQDNLDFPGLIATAARQRIVQEVVLVNPSRKPLLQSAVRWVLQASQNAPSTELRQAAGEMRLWLNEAADTRLDSQPNFESNLDAAALSRSEARIKFENMTVQPVFEGTEIERQRLIAEKLQALLEDRETSKYEEARESDDSFIKYIWPKKDRAEIDFHDFSITVNDKIKKNMEVNRVVFLFVVRLLNYQRRYFYYPDEKLLILPFTGQLGWDFGYDFDPKSLFNLLRGDELEWMEDLDDDEVQARSSRWSRWGVDTRDSFQAYWNVYDKQIDPTLIEAVVQLVAEQGKKNVQVLDLFGGDGRFLKKLHDAAVEKALPLATPYYLVDRDDDLIDRAQTDEIKAIQGDLLSGSVSIPEMLGSSAAPVFPDIIVTEGGPTHMIANRQTAWRVSQAIYDALPDGGYYLHAGYHGSKLTADDFRKLGFEVLNISLPSAFQSSVTFPKQFYILRKPSATNRSEARVQDEEYQIVDQLISEVKRGTAHPDVASGYQPGFLLVRDAQEIGDSKAGKLRQAREDLDKVDPSADDRQRVERLLDALENHPGVDDLWLLQLDGVVNRIIKRYSGSADAFQEHKARLDVAFFEIQSFVRDEITKANDFNDKLRMAMAYAAIGNLMDLSHPQGIQAIADELGVAVDNHLAIVKGAYEKIVGENHVLGAEDRENFLNHLEANPGGSVLYFTDNHGEVIMDQLVIEVLLEAGYSVSIVSKGEVVRDDVTKAEAQGLAQRNDVLKPYLAQGKLRVITDGSYLLGSDLSQTGKRWGIFESILWFLLDVVEGIFRGFGRFPIDFLSDYIPSFQRYRFVKSWKGSIGIIAKGSGSAHTLILQNLSRPHLHIRAMKKVENGYELLAKHRGKPVEGRNKYDIGFIYQPTAGVFLSDEELRGVHQERFDAQAQVTVHAFLDDIDGNLTIDDEVPEDIVDEYVRDVRRDILRPFVSGRAERVPDEYRERGIHDIAEVYDRVIERINSEADRRYVPNVLQFPENSAYVTWQEWDSNVNGFVRKEIDLVKHYGLVSLEFKFDDDAQHRLYDAVTNHLEQNGFPNPFKFQEKKRYGFAGWINDEAHGWSPEERSQKSNEIAIEIKKFLSAHPEYENFEVVATSVAVDIAVKGINKTLAVRYMQDQFGLDENQIASFDDKASPIGNGHGLTERLQGYSTKEYDRNSRHQVALPLIFGVTGVEARRIARHRLNVSPIPTQARNIDLNFALAVRNLEPTDATDREVLNRLKDVVHRTLGMAAVADTDQILKRTLTGLFLFSDQDFQILTEPEAVAQIRRPAVNAVDAPLILVGKKLSLNTAYVARSEVRVSMVDVTFSQTRITKKKNDRPKISISQALSLSADNPASFFVHFSEVQEPGEAPEEGMVSYESLFGLGFKTKGHEDTNIVVYGFENQMQLADKKWVELRNVAGIKTFQGRLDKAHQLYGYNSPDGDPSKHNVHFSANPTRLRNQLSDQVLRFLSAGFDAPAALLFARSGGQMPGIGEEGGVYSVVGEFLRTQLQEYQASLIVAIAA